MDFFDDIFTEDSQEIIGLTNELKSLYLYKTFKEKKQSIMYVTNSIYDANKMYQSLSNHTKNVCLFLMDDFLTSEAIAVSPELKIGRLETINKIIKEGEKIIIADLMGFLRYLPPKKLFIESYFHLKINQEYSMEHIVKKLYNLGYKKTNLVNMTGEIAVRGFVIDVFLINYENPIRMEFWGDRLDLIREFDIETQLTKTNLNEIEIYPCTEFLVNSPCENKKHRNLIKYTNVNNIVDYLENKIVFYDNYNVLLKTYELLEKEMKDYSKSIFIDENTPYMFNLKTLKYTNEKFFYDFDNISIKKQTKYYSKELEIFKSSNDEINKKLNEYIKKRKKVIICFDSIYKINKFIDKIKNNNVVLTNEKEIYTNKINIIKKILNKGFEINDIIVITENELFGKESKINYKTNFKYGTKIKDISKLEKGDYVVHNIHGIGKYLGIKTILKNSLKKDYLTIEYKNNDKLYIPVEKIDFITKYSGKDTYVKLNKLGSHEWEKTKQRARKKAQDIAEELLKTYAIRESQKGYSFSKDTEEQIIFEKEFQYSETKDQLRVTEEIKKDMESNKPMDRLLCGDVGYGKTEVAFRAIFKAIMDGKQAALLCPTTILSSQHYNNAIRRFSSFAVNIEKLNRFNTTKETNNIINKLKEGKIDLLIGTHRILSNDIKFKDLGLLVIDEEQRFGVKHKEQIKKYKENIDVLTLSATPIPRTLQMSMSGIRSLSLLETPPINRFPIQTFVLEENKQIIKDVLYKELSRNGQSFVLYNKVKNIETKKNQLQKLVPEAKIAIAHGQMTKNELENVMIKYTNKEYDILLCTTIIETGIDIDSSNTLIIIDADYFGLSQLYQIRGRIGRGNKIAYCYLMYNNKKTLSDIATKRLKVIKDFTELGSGFSIAMRDLSLRGAGDILGSEQAGFIDSIGVELFLEMLNEEVKKLTGKQSEKKEFSAMPLLDVETAIDDNYVKDEEIKIEIHKKINTINTKEKLNKVKEELEDRFGKISENLIIYMHEELFEKKAQELNINIIKQNKNSVNIILNKELTNKINGDILFYEATKLSRMFRFGMTGNLLTITIDTIKLDKHFIYYLIDLLEIIKGAIN